MKKNAPVVLVIDDDEVVLVAITDLLEEAHFHVRCQTSPAGAADIAAADPDLVAAVIDLNMPIMRGDNLARMFLSRASLRDMPLVLISGDSAAHLEAVRAKMPHIKVVAKADMEAKLVPVLQQAIAERQRSVRRAWGSEPTPDRHAEESPATRPEAGFLETLGREMALAREIWREVRAGRPQRLTRLVRTLQTLHGEADKLALFQAGQLLRGIEQVGSLLQHGAKLRPQAELSVEKGIDALVAISESPTGGAKFTGDVIVEALRRAAAELRTTREG
jgi:FixJ family two-component response regulator